MKRKIKLLSLVAVFLSLAVSSNAEMANSKPEDTNIPQRTESECLKNTMLNLPRELGDHLFPNPIFFTSPLISPRFGFAQGLHNFSFVISEITDEDTQEVLMPETKYSLLGAYENFDGEIMITRWLGLDLRSKVDAIIGSNMDSVIIFGAMSEMNIEAGLILSPIRLKETGTAISLSGHILSNRGVQISPFKALTQIIEKGYDKGSINSRDVKDALFISSSSFGFRPSIGVAQAIGKILGLQLVTGISFTKDKEEDEPASSNKYINVSSMLSIDSRHIINFPLSLGVEYNGTFDLSGETSSENWIGGGLYYQGNGNIQLGIFGAYAIIPENEILKKPTGRLAQFVMTYFF